MPVPLTQIPDNLLVPGNYQEIDNSLAGSQSDVKRVLVVGIKSVAGVALANKAIAISSKDSGNTQLGDGSPAAVMVANMLELNKTEELWALPLAENPIGIAAVKKIAVSIDTLQPGIAVRYFAGIKVSIGVSAADTDAIIATKLLAAVNAAEGMPGEASIDPAHLNEVLWTCKVKGEVGNFNDITAGLFGETDPAGLTLTVSTVTSGAGNPSLSAALASLGDIRYHFIISDLVDTASLSAWSLDLTDRYSATRQIGGRLFLALSGIAGDATTVGSMIAQAENTNNPHIALVSRGKNPQSPAVWAARIAAVAIRALADDPSANTQGIAVPGLIATDHHDFDTRQKLLESGVLTWKVDTIGTVLIERLVTSYTEAASGSRDTSYLDIQVVETVDAIRTHINAEVARTYKQWKLASTNENFGSGSRVMTTSVFQGFLVSLYQQVFIQEKQWCQDLESYKESLIVEVKAGTKNRLQYQHRPVLIGQFLISAGLNQFK